LADKKAALLRHIAGSVRLAAVRPASRLEVRPQPEMLSTGIPEVDAITGGLPRGHLSEICGAASSGKTSLLLATLAAATRRGESCVLIDASDSFNPASGAAAGMDFSKLLWIRCGGGTSSVTSTRSARSGQAKCSRRSSKLRLSRWADDRKPTTDDALRKNKSGEQNLEQVLKTTDLILQSGSFGLVVLDLAGIPEPFSRRIPLTSWFRFQRVIEPAKTALLVVSESPRTQSCAGLVIEFCSKLSAVSYQLSANPSHTQILEGMRVETEVMRSRMRKPAQSVTAAFQTQAVRAG
jgi:hypothetical protein